MSCSPGTIAIVGAGNIGRAIADGLVKSHIYQPRDIILTRRTARLLEPFAEMGYRTTTDNREAVRHAVVVVLAVAPRDAAGVLQEIAGELDPERHVFVSVVTGVTVAAITSVVGHEIPVIRAMPNTAIAIQHSMTCLATSDTTPADRLAQVRALFDTMGRSYVIHEDQMLSATSLCACGTAFFLRCIRAASQGGVEIGFHADEALFLAAQTALGAAQLLLHSRRHPEEEIDKVTTPRGITISGLNQMEHNGLSSAMIRGIVVSAEKAAKLFHDE